MKDIKIRITSEEHCRQVQEWLFSLGYKWFAGGKQLKYLESKWLFIDESPNITYSCDIIYGEQHRYKEIFLPNQEVQYEIY